MEDLPAWFGGLPGSLEDEPPDYENKNSLATDEPEVTCLACAFDLTSIMTEIVGNCACVQYPIS